MMRTWAISTILLSSPIISTKKSVLMSTSVTLHNTSGTNGGACDCDDSHVQGPEKSGSVNTINAGQTANWDLSALGWDKYEGQEFEVAARCED